MYETILVEKKKKIGILTLNRPEKLNAINLQMKKEVCRALDRLEDDENLRVVILTGAGRAFSSGVDIGSLDSDTIDFFASFKEEEKLWNFDKPIIAALNGYALGDGLQHALLCDIIIASREAELGFIGAKVGGICHVAAWALAGVVGRNKASELLFTCDQIDAEEAHKIGLVNEVVTDNQLMPTAFKTAEKIAECAPLSIKYTKQTLREGLFDADTKRSLKEKLKETWS